jgi:hypothetical protein
MISFRVGIAGTTRPRAKWPVTVDDDADVHKKFAPNRRTGREASFSSHGSSHLTKTHS